MLARFAAWALASLLLLPACESCDFTFGARDVEVDVILEDLDGALLDDAAANTVLDGATVEVCREDHDGRDCDVYPLRDVLFAGPTSSQSALDLSAVYDGESYPHLTRCYYPGLELTITAPDCVAEPFSVSRTRSDDTDATDAPTSIRLECER